MFNSKQLITTMAIGAACYLTLPTYAQSSQSTADKKYEMGLYDDAAERYQAMIDADGGKDFACYERLAKCYLYTNRPSKAIEVYEQASLTHDLPAEAYLDWASALKKIGHSDEAHDLMSFASMKKGVRFDQIDLPSVQTYMVRGLALNTDGDEFAPIFNGDKLAFVSQRDGIRQARAVSNKAAMPNYEIYTAKADASERTPLRMIRDAGAQEGAISYAPDGKWVAYTQVNIPEGQSPKMGNGKSGTIFLAELDETGAWGRRIALPCNDIGVANIYPHFAHDGAALYFASNRPGGHGGYDIYKITRIGDGWSQPVNLGPHVNSEVDEISPYTDQGELYFSSNRTQSAGGFDMYGYKLASDAPAYNLGADLNSTFDDYALITKDGAKSGYFTSNRPGGKGGEDILAFHRINAAPSDVLETASEVSTTTSQPTTVTTAPTNTTSRSGHSPSVALSASAEPTNLVMSGQDVPVFRTATAETDPERILAVFTVQVAAYREQNNSYKRIASRLGDLGFVYRVYYHDMVKIRVGQFENEAEARALLVRVKDRGFTDAFVVKEELVKEAPLSHSTNVTTDQTTSPSTHAQSSSKSTTSAVTPEPVVKAPSSSTAVTSSSPPVSKKEVVKRPAKVEEKDASNPAPQKQTTGAASSVEDKIEKAPVSSERIEKIRSQVTRYRLKLGSYTDMSQFDAQKVRQYGSLFNETRDEFTMVFLGDYMTIEDAQSIAQQLSTEGFSSVVIYGVAGDTLVKVK